MGKLLHFPGSKIPSETDIVDQVVTDLMKEVAGVFIEQRIEQGPSEAWYRDIRHFVTQSPVPTENGEVCTRYLRRWRSYWRGQALDYIRFYNRDI